MTQKEIPNLQIDDRAINKNNDNDDDGDDVNGPGKSGGKLRHLAIVGL